MHPHVPIVRIGIASLFGFVSAICFFFPGWQYHKQRGRRER